MSAWNAGSAVVDHEYFEKIDSERKAYWLGFITADGSIYPPQNRLILALKAEDLGHLETFRLDLAIGVPARRMKNGERFEQARIAVASPKLISDLSALGLQADKSSTCRPAVVAEDLVRHYWRGIVDGDGFLSTCTKHGKLHPRLGLCGTLAVVEEFAAQCRDVASSRNYPTKVSGTADHHYATAVTGSKALTVARWLYQDAVIALPRKLAVYQYFESTDFGIKPRIWKKERKGY